MTERSNKLVSLLASLDKSQIRACRKLVQSPWFGGNDALLAFFDALVRSIAKGKAIDKQVIWKAATDGKKAFNDVRFRKFSSDLFKLVREFLVQESLAEEPRLRRYLYLAALEKQHPDKLVRGIERNWERLSKTDDAFDANSFLYEHLLEKRKYFLLNYHHRPYDRSNVEAVSASLDAYFIIMKLESAVRVQSRMQTEQHQYDLKLTGHVIDYLDQDATYLAEPLVALHYYMYKMLVAEEDHSYYHHYKDIIQKLADDFGGDRGYEFFQPALNYSRRQINRGNQDFLREYLDVYRFALPRGYVFDDGVLDPLQFRNTVLTALRVGEYEWAEGYIRNYQDRLPEKQRQNAVNFSSATLYFYQQDYAKALGFLRDVEYENITYNLNAKTMLLAIYYETDEIDALESLFDSISTYLHRHKELPTTATEAYGNLVAFTRRLTRMIPGNEDALDALKRDLTERKYVASRPWLEEKIGQFTAN